MRCGRFVMLPEGPKIVRIRYRTINPYVKEQKKKSKSKKAKVAEEELAWREDFGTNMIGLKIQMSNAQWYSLDEMLFPDETASIEEIDLRQGRKIIRPNTGLKSRGAMQFARLVGARCNTAEDEESKVPNLI